jgi:hypothetical protein
VTSEDPVDAEGAFLDYYLDGMRAVEAEGGRRLIDGVDLHWFSEARGADGDGVRIVESADATAAEARVQAPRSLWDPTYRERSWIVDDVIHGPIALIPTLRQRIEAHYPGTELVLGSWLFGGELHISGAIAVADVLGVLGRQQVQIAALARGSRFSLAGFRVFTNYDGTGSRFGDLSIGATSADVEALTAYASVDSQDLDRVTVVLINKREIPTRTGVRVHHPTLLSAAECFQLTAEQEAIVRCPQLRATGTNGFVHEMPAWSITLLVVRAG